MLLTSWVLPRSTVGDERGITRDRVSVSGHWKRGIADYDHHEPIDDDVDAALYITGGAL